jgi:hypothetical protein
MRIRQGLHALRGWFRSLVLEWPNAVRVTTETSVRDISRVIRHEVLGGTHLLIEDIDGVLYLWRLDEVKRYGPIQRVEVPAHMLQPIKVVG